MERFGGTVEPLPTVDVRGLGTLKPLTTVDVRDMAAWVGAIPFEAWPQQNRLPDGKIRPAMVTDPGWFGFGAARERITNGLMDWFPEGEANNHMLSVVMPGADVYPHADAQPADWLVRVHVPLLTNLSAWFICEGERFHLAAGIAYLVNTERTHEIRNDGPTPRIHYMFDVRRRTA